MRAGVLLLALVTFVTAAPAKPARPVDQNFVVSYQGRELGKASITWTRPEKGRFQVRGRADIRHPQKSSTVYSFSVDMAFQIEGRRMKRLSAKNSFNAEAEAHHEAIENLVPFLTLVQTADFPSLDRPTEVSYLATEGYYQLRWFPGPSELEAVLSCDDQLVARFWVRPVENRIYRLYRISIAAAGDQMVDFMLDDGRGGEP